MTTTNRVQPGVPAGGQFAPTTHAESDVELGIDPIGVDEPRPHLVGGDPAPISLAEARRMLPEGQRVQVVYLNGQRPDDDGTPIEREVTKQTAHQMITTGPGVPNGSYLGWAKQQAQRDSDGNIIISDDSGHPYVAYIPLHSSQEGVSDLVVKVQAVDDIAAARTTDDVAMLSVLAESPVAAVRRYVAANPASDAAVLLELRDDPDLGVRRAVAQHPNASGLALAALARDEDQEVRYHVAAHTRTESLTLRHLSESPDAGVRRAVAGNPNTSEATLKAMHDAGERTAEVRSAIGRNPKTPAHVLERLARSDGFTMGAVAKNPNTPAHVLDQLAANTSTGNQTRALAASNPSLPSNSLRRLSADPDRWVRQHAATNPALDGRDGQRLASDPDERVRHALARNPNAEPATLNRLRTDPDPAVRAAATRHRHTTAEQLRAAATDPSFQVRVQVAKHPNTPHSVLVDLSTRDDTSGSWAQRTLNERHEQRINP